MLVATRDPMHPSGAPDPSAHRHERLAAIGSVPHTQRAMSLLQLAGSFLAIPVALGSAYSVYTTNFSPDTRCEQLRGSIIAMIDKKIDAATRRMLVRRDVEAFEKSCGAFDPDAKAAFVMLLQDGSRTVPARPVAAAKVEKPEPKKAEVAKVVPVKAEPVKVEAAKAEPVKVEPPKAEVAKAEPAKAEVKKAEAPVAVAKSAPVATEAHEPANNDAVWLAAVRGALTAHETAAAATPAPVLRASVAPAAPAMEQPPSAAPALPPATAVPEPARAEQVDPDRPVPPGAIPEAQGNAGRSTWVSSIPFVGQMLDK